MSRWREMMMDYGQIFGSDHKSETSSNVFSLGSDLKNKGHTDLELRRILEVHFRPLFQRFVYGGEKIACHDMRRLLHDPEYRHRLPADKIQELADVADFNKGKAISYAEFCNIVLNQMPIDDLASQGSFDELSSSRGGFRRSSPSGLSAVLSYVCRNTTSQVMVEEKMSNLRPWNFPFFMLIVTVAQIVIYVAMCVDSDVSIEALDGVPADNKIIYLPNRRREVWRWLTYCFLHQGAVDLFFNVLIQVCLGIPLELMFSWWRIAIIYVAGIMAGSCAHSVSEFDNALVGAGGGAYALISAHIIVLIWNWKNFNNDPTETTCKKVLCSLVLRLCIILLVVAPQIGLAVYRRWFMDDISLQIGVSVYIGGLVAGVTMGDPFISDYRRSPFERCIGLFALCSLAIIIGACAIFNIVYERYPIEDRS